VRDYEGRPAYDPPKTARNQQNNTYEKTIGSRQDPWQEMVHFSQNMFVKNPPLSPM
jgi:hypothetical protein